MAKFAVADPVGRNTIEDQPQVDQHLRRQVGRTGEGDGEPPLVDELTRAASRAELENRLLQVQARTAIELALATRIQTATHVEIEEHYAVSGDAGVGVGIEAQHVGVHGHGRTVTQRAIRLEGWRVPDDISRAAKGAHDEPSTDAPARSSNGRTPL